MTLETKKRRCFVITPIGGEEDPIRRHIDGIIDAAIIPALTEFEVTVAHRMYKSGSITKQVIEAIHSADLVIANVTDRNPNVMYELAIRHCLGTPTIMIAERNTELPSDIISERTIFYQNDAKGVLELINELNEFVDRIDYSTKNSIVYDVLGEVINSADIIAHAKQRNPDDADVLDLILNRLDTIEDSLNKRDTDNYINKNINYLYKDILQNLQGNNEPIKIHELAKELNMTSKDLLDEVNKMGIDVKSHMSTLSAIDATAVRNKFSRNKTGNVLKNFIYYDTLARRP